MDVEFTHFEFGFRCLLEDCFASIQCILIFDAGTASKSMCFAKLHGITEKGNAKGNKREDFLRQLRLVT